MEMVKTLTGSANTAFWVSDTEKLSDKYIPISDTLRSLDCAGTGCPKTFTDFANGKHSCRYLRGSGTACVFECDLGFKLKGARVLRCLERKGDDPEKWSRPQPTCEVALCYELEPVKFGGMNCSDGVKPGSVCVFHCDEYYFREGPTQVECGKLQSGEWSEASATCATDLLCLPALQKIENGELQCPDGNQFNAVCTYKCTEGFLLSGSHKLRCSTPLQEGGAAWNKKPPTCVKCPITPCALDIVVAVDSSEYMQEEKFKETITAVENLLNRFDGSIDQGIAHAGLIQVNGKPTFDCLSSYVDKKLKVELDLAEYSIEQVIEALKNTSSKFGCPTVESAIARGASYIKAVGRENTKRVLILVTDADVSTEKFSEVAAKTQQEEGVRVIVVGRDTSGESTDVVVKGLNRHGRLVVTPSFVGTTTPIEELILTFTNRASGFKQPCGWLGYFALYVLIRALSR
nr:uncharacterized protein LOC108949641 [Ciona intestinalis]|eukprot:XP_018668247.1 uncharacterized protein LOC108949641 [Ciona intestinalis]